jgi:hypothetical protein
VTELPAKRRIMIEEMHSHVAERCLELEVVRGLFLFISMQKIASSPLEFAPVDEQLRG